MAGGQGMGQKGFVKPPLLVAATRVCGMGRIVVSNLGKAIKTYPSRWQRLAEWLLPSAGVRHQKHWLLRNINFALEPGESVGIIGMNGAGKSTLLKMIAGILRPSSGTITHTGRIAALLELGLGFHPEFTGRQNIFMAGQLMGFSSSELTDLLPSIEAFAEIGDYIDEPVRVYSTGMQVRLAFSLATAVRPDILIVDEALSVGDAYFQHKSFDRIRRFKADGTTLLLVSHDRAAIQSICDRAILLHEGALLADADAPSVVDYYNALLAGSEQIEQSQFDAGTQTLSGNRKVVIRALALSTTEQANVDVVAVGARTTLTVEAQIVQDIDSLVCGYVIKNRFGQDMYGTNSYHFDKTLHGLRAGSVARFGFEFPMNLNAGEYSIAVALTAGETHVEGNYEWRDLAKVFTVVNANVRPFTGFAYIEPSQVTVEVVA